MLRNISILLGAPLLVLRLAGCSEPADAAVGEGTVLIDVRTPEEYAMGHLAGAQLLDLNSGEFAATLPQLSPDTEYFVYCRSGNRSGQAVKMMQDAGFTDLTNLGSLEEAAEATGIAIVS
ncbi:MAG: rhodanese-like domain-containing protein [Arachnia sp.]